MSEDSVALEEALGILGRLLNQLVLPAKTREETEAFLADNPAAAHWRILDFIYGKPETITTDEERRNETILSPVFDVLLGEIMKMAIETRNPRHTWNQFKKNGTQRLDDELDKVFGPKD